MTIEELKELDENQFVSNRTWRYLGPSFYLHGKEFMQQVESSSLLCLALFTNGYMRENTIYGVTHRQIIDDRVESIETDGVWYNAFQVPERPYRNFLSARYSKMYNDAEVNICFKPGNYFTPIKDLLAITRGTLLQENEQRIRTENLINGDTADGTSIVILGSDNELDSKWEIKYENLIL